MKKQKKTQGIGGWEMMVEEVKSCMIYLILCRNLCKCYNVPTTHHNNKGIKPKREKVYFGSSLCRSKIMWCLALVFL
jgi:hypothetical protein